MKFYRPHRPNHIYTGGIYFLTSRTYNQEPYFLNEDRKKLFIKILQESIKKFDIKIYAWIILDNHYHLLFNIYGNERTDKMNEMNFVRKTDFPALPAGQSVTPDYFDSKYVLIEFVRKIHKDTARIINQQDNTPARKIWYQYRDYCIRNEKDFFTHFNYILKNPLKHKLVGSLEESFKYNFSSNPQWLKKFTLEGLNEGFLLYPVKEEDLDLD